MKITKKQKEAIIKEAIKQQIEFPEFLCIRLKRAIKQVINIDVNMIDIQEYIPNFKKEIAEEYFKSPKDMRYAWWNTEPKDYKLRLKFLNYLLTSKLPKKVSKKK